MDFFTSSQAMISPTWNCMVPNCSKVISSFGSISITASSFSAPSAASPLPSSAASSLCGCSSSTFFITSSRSSLWNRISGFCVTCPSPSCSSIFLLVDGIKDSRSRAPAEIPWIRFQSTVSRRSFFASSFASAHGIVSSIYLLQRLNRLKISVIASATLRSFIFASTAFGVFSITAFRSASTSSATPLSVTVPPKYLFVMETVRFTRFPSVFARSEFRRSTISSQVITPSFSNGISWSTK